MPRVTMKFSSNVIPATCPSDALMLDPAVSCGYVPVPLNRRHTNGAKIQIYFELYPHSGPGPAESAILFNVGGPGVTTTGLRGAWVPIFWGNIDKHDLLLVDDRGRGLSSTINCPELQSVIDVNAINWDQVALLDPAMAHCAAQLGNAASLYGTGDVAQDMDDVRAALGYDKVDYVGVSWGGADAIAYATRFGKHVRSLVLDAPVGPPMLESFGSAHYEAQALPRMVSLVCLRSPNCSAGHPFAAAELAWLIDTIRRNPIEGNGYDADGHIRHVRIDEAALASYVIFTVFGNFTNTGELLAAAASLRQGDRVPLLRLAAEDFFPFVAQEPSYHSQGARFATLCADIDPPWAWSAPGSTRERQYEDAVSDLPPGYFAPLSKAAATSIFFSLTDRRCLRWEIPTPSSPVVPPHATYPRVPTLVLTGDLDAIVPIAETTRVAALFPHSSFLTVAGAGHPAIGWSLCGRKIESQFLETLQPGDTSCAKTPEVVWPAVGRFPLSAAQARPADVDPSGQNQIGVPERRVVTVTVAAAIDALQRTILGTTANGVGLRGGTFQTNFLSAGWLTTLTNCAFASDVTVNGTVSWSSDSSLESDLTVSGPGTSGGTLHVAGAWLAPGPAGNFIVTGTLGGKQVAVLVPEA
jgi:pimeloyl-ACP methyl ester carboxylesterase